MHKIPIKQCPVEAINDSLRREGESKEKIVAGHKIQLNYYDVRRDGQYRVYWAHRCCAPNCNVIVRKYIVHYECERSCDESKFMNLLK